MSVPRDFTPPRQRQHRANSGAVSKRRAQTEPVVVDWDAAIERFKGMLAVLYADESEEGV